MPFETPSVVRLLVENATVLMLSDRLVAFDARPPWCLSHLVPEVEAPNVELNGGPIPIQRNALHEELVLRDRLLASGARLAIAGPAPDSRDAVVREATILELPLDEETKRQWVHRWRSGWRSGETEPDSPGTRRQRVKPEGHGEGTQSVSLREDSGR